MVAFTTAPAGMLESDLITTLLDWHADPRPMGERGG
jgi:hypothetical protein